jgi:hypothetical protein
LSLEFVRLNQRVEIDEAYAFCERAWQECREMDSISRVLLEHKQKSHQASMKMSQPSAGGEWKKTILSQSFIGRDSQSIIYLSSLYFMLTHFLFSDLLDGVGIKQSGLLDGQEETCWLVCTQTKTLDTDICE